MVLLSKAQCMLCLNHQNQSSCLSQQSAKWHTSPESCPGSYITSINDTKLPSASVHLVLRSSLEMQSCAFWGFFLLVSNSGVCFLCVQLCALTSTSGTQRHIRKTHTVIMHEQRCLQGLWEWDRERARETSNTSKQEHSVHNTRPELGATQFTKINTLGRNKHAVFSGL